MNKNSLVCDCLREGNEQSCCRNYIDFEQDCNCVLVAVENSGSLNLRQVGERFGCTHVRIMQIEKKAIAKLKKLCNNSEEIKEILDY